MKDAKGHGSDAGLHAAGISGLPKKLTRAHFEQIAENLLKTKPADESDRAANEAFSARLSAAADHLATTNPGFNRNRFIAAASGNIKGSGLRSKASSRTNASKKANNVYDRLSKALGVPTDPNKHTWVKG